MQIVQEVVSTILAAREKANTPIRWPLARVSIRTQEKKIKDAVKKHDNLIKYIVNSLDLEVTGQVKNIDYKIKADYAKLGPKYDKKVPEIIVEPELLLSERGTLTFNVT